MTMEGHGDLLVELCTEELPPSSFHDLVTAFPDEVAQGLDRASLEHGEVRGFGSPRHLAVLVRDVALGQPDRPIERRGPAVRAAFDEDGKPTRAAQGFAQSVGVDVPDLERMATDKGEWLVYRGTEPGRETASLLP
ncbi:MAG TPA: glycine--tRNA ligase subunit beta, partial [Gammaproteobacteria bacterium]|nr:glycine--tRNA ligase subunit beta [Gammaproteobacteria bacterium]